MKSSNKRIVKNVGFLMTSQLLTWGMTIFLTLFLPRILGTEGVGQLHLADSIWSIVGVFIAFGMDTYLTKVVARSPEKSGELLGVSIILRTALFVIGFIAVMIFANLTSYAWLTIVVIYVYGIGRLLTDYTAAAGAVLGGLERMGYIALANIISKAFLTIVTIAVLLLGYGVVAVAIVIPVASLLAFIIQLIHLRRIQPLKLSFSRELALNMLKASTPYVLIVVFSVVYMNLDAIFISLIVDEETLGWYSGADRLFGTLLFVPTTFIMAVFPALSRLNEESPEELRTLLRRSFDMLLLLGVPIGLGVIAVSENLVTLLYGEPFRPSGAVLAVMGVVLIFTYQNILLGRFMMAIDKQNIWTVVMAVATAATVVLDLIFIPLTQDLFGNGAIGGGLSFVVTEIAMTLVGLRFLPEGALNRQNASVAARVALAGLIMTAAIWPLRNFFIAIPVAVGGVVYLALILLLRAVSDEDKNLFKGMGMRIWRRTLGRRSQPVGVDS